MIEEEPRTISKIHTEIRRLDAATSTSNPFVEDVGASTRTTYESFHWFLELSDSFLDTHIPSYPGSLRSLRYQSGSSQSSLEPKPTLAAAINFLHADHDFLHYAEIGDDMRLELCISDGVNLNEKDEAGRTALHFAVQTGNMRAINMLLDEGAAANVKDCLAMTPLILCLMRRPSLEVAMLLFEHGAEIPPRSVPVDSGLFLQFVMMCLPTSEEAKILQLLINKGALINDPEVPGGRSVLHFAAMSNNCDLIRVLMGLGANLFAVNHRGQTPLDVATTFQCEEAAVLLTEYVMKKDLENENLNSSGERTKSSTQAYK